MRPLIIAMVVLTGVSNFVLNREVLAEEVSKEKVEEIRQLAIESGQVSSSSDPKPVKSEQEKAAERAALESHRKSFFKRTYDRNK